MGRELRPDSALLARLQASRGNAAGVRFVSLIAGSDNIVFPRVFAVHDDEVHLADLGHLSMLFSPRALRVVADHLTAPLARGASAPALLEPRREARDGSDEARREALRVVAEPGLG